VSALTLQDSNNRKPFEPLAGQRVGVKGDGLSLDPHL
jgi:hypothetical protein